MLLHDVASALGTITHFLGLRADEAVFPTAIERSRFEILRAEEELNPKNPEEFSFRKGRAGTGVEELTPETQRAIAAAARPIYDRARTMAESV